MQRLGIDTSLHASDDLSRVNYVAKRDHDIPGPTVSSVEENDVLCGRGSVICKHSGNFRFRRIVIANKTFYNECKKNAHKFFLALSIVLAIERRGGRFLRQDRQGNSWTKIPRREAVAKTAQALRDQIQSIKTCKTSHTTGQDGNPCDGTNGQVTDPALESGAGNAVRGGTIAGTERSCQGFLESPTQLATDSDQIWVPRELENLMLSDPRAVQALTSL